jgi:hypothetical protein
MSEVFRSLRNEAIARRRAEAAVVVQQVATFLRNRGHIIETDTVRSTNEPRISTVDKVTVDLIIGCDVQRTYRYVDWASDPLRVRFGDYPNTKNIAYSTPEKVGVSIERYLERHREEHVAREETVQRNQARLEKRASAAALVEGLLARVGAPDGVRLEGSEAGFYATVRVETVEDLERVLLALLPALASRESGGSK